MLIGVGGSGKQSLTKMAAFVGNMACLSIEISRGYGIREFREDIKKFMLKTGVEGLDTVFLFTDSQVRSYGYKSVLTLLKSRNLTLCTNTFSSLQ